MRSIFAAWTAINAFTCALAFANPIKEFNSASTVSSDSALPLRGFFGFGLGLKISSSGSKSLGLGGLSVPESGASGPSLTGGLGLKMWSERSSLICTGSSTSIRFNISAATGLILTLAFRVTGILSSSLSIAFVV